MIKPSSALRARGAVLAIRRSTAPHCAALPRRDLSVCLSVSVGDVRGTKSDPQRAA